MIRLAFLFLALLANRHWLWNADALDDGAVHVWAGTAFKFGLGPHVCLEWDAEGLVWGVLWCDRDDPQSEYERDAWGFEGRNWR